jgi:hypothetical protein
MPNDKPWIDAPPPPPDLEKARRRAWTALGLATTPLLLWGACTTRILDPDSESVGIAMLIVLGASLVGGALGIASLVAKRTALGWIATFAGFMSPVIAFFLAAFTIPFSRGRAHRRRGAAKVPHDTANDAWLDEATLAEGRHRTIEAPSEHREALATAWRAMAATETASVAAFASFAQQLLALGAPSRFVEDAHRDAIDEVAHARVCYGIAARLDGHARGPAPFPAAAWPPDHAPSLLRLARDTLRDGCVFEGASARVAEELAALDGGCAETRRALAVVAVDEARHAAHAWEVLAWARAQLRPEEDASLDAVIDELLVAQHDAVVPHDRFEAFGVAGPARWRDAVRETAARARTRLRTEAPAHRTEPRLGRVA